MTREEAIKYLIRPFATSTEIGEEKQKEFDAYDMAIEALSRLKGEWIEQEDCFMDTYYKCSECGFEWKFISGTPKENGANYCPNCGADMRGGDAE